MIKAMLALLMLALLMLALSAGCTRTQADMIEDLLSDSTVQVELGTAFITTGLKTGKPIVVTNWHVCARPGDRIIIHRPGQSDVAIRAELTSAKADLCAGYVASHMRPLKMAKSLSLNETVYTYGYPAGRLTFSKGVIVGTRSTIMNFGDFTADCQGPCIRPYLFTSTTLLAAPGSSGSPVVNEQGELVGVVENAQTDVTPTWSAGIVPFEALKEFLEAL